MKNRKVVKMSMIHKEKSSFWRLSFTCEKNVIEYIKRGRTWRRMMEEKQFAVEETISAEEIRKELEAFKMHTGKV